MVRKSRNWSWAGDLQLSDPADDDPNLPLGFVFLGQFIDHDITLDVTSGLKRAFDDIDPIIERLEI